MKTLIIGGGLSGLALADTLEAKGQEYLLLEARDRFGGRVFTEYSDNGYFDMGPAWFWPGQPRIAALLRRLNLEPFEQYAEGDLMYENADGSVERGRGFSSMQGSWRVRGGFAAVTAALAQGLPDNRKRLNAEVAGLSKTPQGITATLSGGETLTADLVVVALPPRLAATIEFIPALPQSTKQAMEGVATWMAGQAKAVAVYDRPFWRENGLSGDAMSRHGPMVEIHDASPLDGGSFALFGFLGVPPFHRQDVKALRTSIQAQLSRLFGADAANPTHLYLKDWALDPLTATQADHALLTAHPAYGLPQAMENVWEGRVRFAGTEVAPQFGGYIEGALEAAENVARMIGS